MCDFSDKYTKLKNWSCVLNCCSGCPGVFVTDIEMNGDKYLDLPFICFHHYENINSCSFHKKILPEHGKTFPSFTNIENV